MSGTAPPVAEPAPAPIVEPPTGTPSTDRASAAERALSGDDLTAYVLVFTPGDHPFYKFGHNAIWLHDPHGGRRRDVVYNWGTFSFGDPALIPKFVVGRFMYWLSTANIESTKYAYKRENRGIRVQELNLTGAQKLDLKRRLNENALDANKYYKYDYYRDNCSTRVRDMLDAVIGGRIRAESENKPARMTYRDHTLRLTGDLPAEYVALNLVMGDFIDKPISQWDEAFIPMELEKTLRNVTVLDEQGNPRPLVKVESILVETDRKPPFETPPTYWPYALISGLLFGALFALCGRTSARSTLARIFFGLGLSFWGLVAGFFGFFFIGVWCFTDHAVGYGNENLFFCTPFAIVLVGYGVQVMRHKLVSMRRARRITDASLVLAIAGTVLKVLPWFDQKNGFFILFFLPLWAGIAYGMRIALRDAEAKASLLAAAAKAKPLVEAKSDEVKAGAKKAMEKNLETKPDEKPSKADD